MRRLLAASALALTTVATASACGAGGHASSGPSFGPLPSWLPTAAPVHVVKVATDSRPVYASQGDSVDVHLTTGDALVTVVGPETPGQGLDPDPAGAFCTWTVTVRGETGSVPIVLADFSSIDETGRLYAMSATQGEHPPPARVRAGTTVTFQMRTNMPNGEGLLHWEPGGRLSPVAWDFTVETD